MALISSFTVFLSSKMSRDFVRYTWDVSYSKESNHTLKCKENIQAMKCLLLFKQPGPETFIAPPSRMCWQYGLFHHLARATTIWGQLHDDVIQKQESSLTSPHTEQMLLYLLIHPLQKNKGLRSQSLLLCTAQLPVGCEQDADEAAEIRISPVIEILFVHCAQ